MQIYDCFKGSLLLLQIFQDRIAFLEKNSISCNFKDTMKPHGKTLLQTSVVRKSPPLAVDSQVLLEKIIVIGSALRIISDNNDILFSKISS